jgi:hypothetical protein
MKDPKMTIRGDLARKIRALAWAAPVVVSSSQQGCVVSSTSCDRFQSQRQEQRVPLETGDAGRADAGALSTEEGCRNFCNRQNAASSGKEYSCRTEPGDGGGTVVVCAFNTVCEGRRPEGYLPGETDIRLPLLGRYFAAMAATESASVIAFERMAEELLAHGAPADLVQRARTAAADEERHFTAAAALANRFGATPARAAVARAAQRSLFDFALENAREGVVRETLGAAMGFWQARHAAEPSVRSALAQIAEEETSHAVLSHDVDAWARALLSDAERALLDAARTTAVEGIERELDTPVPRELVEEVGVPPREVVRAMVKAARAELWS